MSVLVEAIKATARTLLQMDTVLGAARSPDSRVGGLHVEVDPTTARAMQDGLHAVSVGGWWLHDEAF